MTYILQECISKKIVALCVCCKFQVLALLFELIKLLCVAQVRYSGLMELLGLEQSLNFLSSAGVKVRTLVTDRSTVVR